MNILGIETSCDETALALIETRKDGKSGMGLRVLASLVHSQAELHSAYGGVYPTLAKREHGKNIVPLLGKLLEEHGNIVLKKLSEPSREPSPPGTGDGENVTRPEPAHVPWQAGEGPGGSEGQCSHVPTTFKDILERFKDEIGPQNPELFASFSHADFLQGPAPAIDAIAVTEGPGLEPALWVGINFARMLAALWQVPIIPVDHMEGHIVGSLLPSDAVAPADGNGGWQRLHDAPMPAIALLISGGHTQLVKVCRHGAGTAVSSRPAELTRGIAVASSPLHLRAELASSAPGDSRSLEQDPRTFGNSVPAPFSYTILGETKDDAVGEAFDKTARLLGLPYPGGPHLSELARKAREEKIPALVKLPRPMINSGDLDLSFSGLKTAVLYVVRDADKNPDGSLPDAFRKSLAQEFETAVADVLDFKLRAAIDKIGAKSIILGGGVSANSVLRARFEAAAVEYGIPVFMPSRHISGDNALMIAVAAAIHAHEYTGTPPTARRWRADGTKRLGDARAHDQ
ncbi:MAG: hypothetical protein KGI49_00140 [Patescibacteria group bacterium]|nr:hypothetical protein [Patescibacteria group bacterium]